ncbi:MAG: CsbD family protein [Mycobacterium sp.]|uniref:CsbD family protein n=1 Tax=Mycobacterium sp. TaxID=1785 RepID=UPI003BAF4DC8
MGFVDKAKNAVEDAAGKAKEQAGKVTGDRHTEGQGKKDQATSSLKKAGENIKDAVK